MCLLLSLGLPGTSGHGQENARTFGRRLSLSGDTLVLTEPDLDRIVLYDVSGPEPRKRLAFGDPGSRPGELNGPHGAVLDGQDLYVADSLNHRVQVFRLPELPTDRPRLLRAWGALGTAIGELKAPQGLLFAPTDGPLGRLFVLDTGNHRVQAFRLTGQPGGVVLGTRHAEVGKLDTPVAAAFDPTGTVLYVVDSVNRRISAFDPKASRVLFESTGEAEEPVAAPAGLAVDGEGTLYVTDIGRRQVRTYKVAAGPDGRLTGLRGTGAWGRPGAGAGEWGYPQAISVDAKRRVYVCDMDDRCQYFSADGRFLGTFGDDVSETPAPETVPAGSVLPASVCSNGGRYRVDFVGAPLRAPADELFGFVVGLREGCATPRRLSTVAVGVDARMPLLRQGLNTPARIRPRGDGRYVVEGLRFHRGGLWEIQFDITSAGVTERAQVDVWIE